jgi:hypothetical protein
VAELASADAAVGIGEETYGCGFAILIKKANAIIGCPNEIGIVAAPILAE